MRKYILLLLLIIAGERQIYSKVFVSTSLGNDNNSGLTESAPIYSVKRALEISDEIYLKAGDFFHENLYLNHKEVRRYGEGTNPTICGYKRIIHPNWVNVGGNIWKINLATDNFTGYQTGSSLLNNIGCLHDFKNDQVHGRKVQYYWDLKEDWDIWQTEEISEDVKASQFDELYLYLSEDPNMYNLEFSVGSIAINIHNSTLEGVNVVGWGFGVSAGNGCTIRNCRIDAIGGRVQLGRTPFVCYGNGIEFYVAYDISNSLVENCYISRCYDCACTIQGSRHEGAIPSNIVFRNNLIVGCCYGWEDFLNNGEYSNYNNCRFENNILVYSLSGFGYPTTAVRYSHVVGNNTTGNRGMLIKKNKFYGGNLYRSGSYEGHYKSNIWNGNKFFTSMNSYLLCNYLGTKDYLLIKGEKKDIRELENRYRLLTGDKETKIYYYSPEKIARISEKAIQRYLKKHTY